ncbi:hypothetical protein L210DRAFT_3650225 [Boletus edulis BED1]|uniref:Uncharacterized protein n=1 Tax=Boletus edulis BED1 TaxID=1328754 RepID=A0AAD4BK64_BOLED|nr:hypothetical protein L210DRAFT_3650225 [Boletus edulis BED1]
MDLSWTMLVSSPSSSDEYKFPTWAVVLFLTALIKMVTFYLGDSTGHFDRLLEAKVVNLAWTSYGLLCIHVAFGGFTKHLLNKYGDPNDLAIIIGFGAFATLVLGFRIYCYSRDM